MPCAHVLRTLPPEEALVTQPRPYCNHAVELKKRLTAAERAQMLEAVGLNVLYFPAEMVTGCDLLPDSGTTTLTNEQWAALHLGDEAYGSNGHAVSLDINKYFADTAMQPADFGGLALTAILRAAYGHLAVELGNFADSF